jgi:hypothetical protein
MDERPSAITEPQPFRYRLAIDGRLDASWAGWFDSVAFRNEGDQTVFEVEVIDQAQLHAVLRRVHDLHLRLVSVTRLARSERDPSEGGVP